MKTLEGMKPTVTRDDLAALRALVEQLPQDDDGTAIFLVQKEIEVTGFSTEWTESPDHIRWLKFDDGETVTATPEEHARLEAEYEESLEEPEGWTRTGVYTYCHTVQSFLTRQAAERYMESNKRDLGKARVYTSYAYRNHETQLLQRTLPLLVGMLQMLEDSGSGQHNVLALVELYQKAEAAMFNLSQRVAALEAELAAANATLEGMKGTP